MSGTQQLFLLCVMVAGGLFAVIGLRDGLPAKREKIGSVVKKSLDEITLQAVQDYMREKVPDREAEIVRRGPLIEHDAGYWQSVKVRGKNAFGGPVFVNWVFRFSLAGDFEECRTLNQFVVHVMNNYSKEECESLCKTMDEANEKAAQ